jgi:hypothetical protein
VSVAALAALALASACAGRSGGSRPDPPTGADTVALRVVEWPGLPNPTSTAPLPEFTLYGDGRVVVATGQRGALRTASGYRLTAAGYRRLYDAAVSAGLGRSRRIDTPLTPDAPVLTFQLRAGAATYTTEVVAASLDDADRQPLNALRRDLRPGSWRHADIAAGPTAYQPTRLATLATWSTTGAAPGSRPWPLSDLAGGAPTPGGLCAIHRADDLATATRLALAATPATRWSSAGNTYLLAFRPLLPDETGCANLGPH